MKNYKIFYEHYPFNMETLRPKVVIIEAESLEDAFDILEEREGKGTIEIFKEPARRYHKEYGNKKGT